MPRRSRAGFPAAVRPSLMGRSTGSVETFGLAVAEAQAMGVPVVVKPLGWVRERVIDGETGHVAEDDESFVKTAIAVLRDDGLWRRWHAAALAHQRGLSWETVAGRFEALIPREWI